MLSGPAEVEARTSGGIRWKSARLAAALDKDLAVARVRIANVFLVATVELTSPRTLGPYAVEWAPTEFKDEVLGRLGGVFRGTVMQFDQNTGFFVADAFWLPPDGDPIGPMALEVSVKAEAPRDRDGEPSTRVRVTQQGFEESDRWRRYYDVIEFGWERALASLKNLLEK